jgi:hypothetical protein
MVSVGAITQAGLLIRQLPLLEALEVEDEVDDEVEELLLVFELELEALNELFDDEPPPQPATVSAPKALNACRRVK